MAQLIKKENISVVVGQYPDPSNPQQMKNRHRTIGELITMQGDDGSTYQFGELWGPHGSTKFKVFDQENASQSAPKNNGHQPQQGGYQQPAQQAYGHQQHQGHGGYSNT